MLLLLLFSVKVIGLAAGYVIFLTDEKLSSWNASPIASPKPFSLAMGFGWVTKITEKSLVWSMSDPAAVLEFEQRALENHKLKILVSRSFTRWLPILILILELIPRS